jgi:hypothetical protein
MNPCMAAEQFTCEEHSLKLAHQAQLEQMTTEENSLSVRSTALS